MIPAAKETDPLLPQYEQAPEISHHQPRSSEINHDPHLSPVGFGKSRAFEQWKYTASPVEQRQEGENEDEDDEASHTIESAMSGIFRTVFGLIFAGCFFAIAVSILNSPSDTGRPSNPWPGHPRPDRSVKERAKAVLDSTPLIDGHNDFAIFIRAKYQNNISTRAFRQDFENGTMPLNVDLPRLRAGRVGGAFWSAFVACPANASYDMTDANYATAVSHTAEQIDLLKRLQAQYPQDFTSPARASSSGREDMLALWQAKRSFFAPISIEGLHQVFPTAPLSLLRHYYALGVRMATLTWNCHNPFADASLVWNELTKPPSVVNGVFRPKEGAVTTRGRAVLREMNLLGMIIDISHTSYWTQKDVLTRDRHGNGLTRAPVVFSHSSAYSICPHPRNVRDDILDLVHSTNSLVMVNFSPDFISCVPSADQADHGEPHFSLPHFYEKNNTLHQVARHIMYIGERVGYEHVGIGSDFDGMGKEAPRGLDGVDKYPDLVAELLTLGMTDEQAKMVVGGNLLRVWKEVDEVSAKMRQEGVEPGLDEAEGY